MTCPDCGRQMERRAMRLGGRAVLALWGLGFLLAAWLGGDLLHDVIEGMQKSLLPMWKLWLPVAVLLAAVVAASPRGHRVVGPPCRAGGPARLLASPA